MLWRMSRGHDDRGKNFGFFYEVYPNVFVFGLTSESSNGEGHS
jgi:hypothetical protein